MPCLAVRWSLIATLLSATLSQADDPSAAGVRLEKPQTQRVRIGVVITAGPEACERVTATTAVPIEWPEQQVKIVEQDISKLVKKVSYRSLGGGSAEQMVVEIPRIPAGEEVRAIITFEITRQTLVAPDETAGYLLPKAADAKLRPYLLESPYIESRHSRIKSAAKEAVAGQEGAWRQVEAIYDWVRERVQYKEGPLKGALQALEDGDGDCEELSSLFIALCRANNIPARLVWVPGHCYPEFCLQDGEGNKHWFPCQAAGAERQFGGMAEYRPILQKGDNFPHQVAKRPVEHRRYVPDELLCFAGKPSIRIVRELEPPTSR